MWYEVWILNAGRRLWRIGRTWDIYEAMRWRNQVIPNYEDCDIGLTSVADEGI